MDFVIYEEERNLATEFGIEFVMKYRSDSYKVGVLDITYGLDFSFNKLTGGIPSELGQLSPIIALNLSHNQLTGSLPKTFSNLTQLESLDISHNNLTGEIPSTLIDLHFLEVFNVAHNNLSGKVPDMKGQFGTFEKSSYEGNPFLCGPPLEKSCTRVDNESPPSPIKSSIASDEKWYEIDPEVFSISFSVSYEIDILDFCRDLRWVEKSLVSRRDEFHMELVSPRDEFYPKTTWNSSLLETSSTQKLPRGSFLPISWHPELASTESVVQSTGSVRKFPDITSSLLDHQSSRLDQSESSWGSTSSLLQDWIIENPDTTSSTGPSIHHWSVRKFPDTTSSLLDHQSRRLDLPNTCHPVYWIGVSVDWIEQVLQTSQIFLGDVYWILQPFLYNMLCLHMAPTMYIVYLRFNGEIIYGQHGAEYQGSQMKFIRVHRGISFVELETKIFNALQLDNQSHRITVTYRCPQEVISPHINYMTLLITDDDGVNLMFDMLDATPELKGIELYISVEDCVGEGVEPLTQDDGDGLVAEDCVGEDVQQMTVHDTAPSTQPSTLGRCTPQLHEIRTSVEDCGPSTRHEYVPYEVNPLAGVHDTMMLECTADDEEENADYDNDSYFDDDDNELYFDDDDDYDDDDDADADDDDADDDDETTDVHNDEVDDVVPSLKPKSSSFTTNTWDNINDTSFNDEVTPLDSWDKKQELRKGLFFKSKIEVQYALKVYSSRVNQEYKVKESNKRKLHVCCKNGCSWRMRACMRSTHGFWEITKYNGPHTCRHPNIRKDGKVFDSNFIEREVRSYVANDQTISVKSLRHHMCTQFGHKISYYKVWDAKQKAIANIFGDWGESYQLLPKFMKALIDSNPGTQVEWKTYWSEDAGCAIFESVFWAFGPSIQGFMHCRPVVSIDATHLYGKYEGKLMIAMATDANNGIYPLAFAPLNAYHRFCIRHLVSNFNTRFHDKRLKNMIQRAGEHNQLRKFNATMDSIRQYNKDAAKILDEETDVDKWTLAKDGGRRYGAMTTNLSECFNGVLKGARNLPITAMVEFIYFKLVHYFNDRRVKTQAQLSSGQAFSTHAMEIFQKWSEKASLHHVIEFNREEGTFQIQTQPSLTSMNKGNHRHVVKLGDRTCSCGKWQAYHIPCSHVIAACASQHINVYQFIDPFYSLTEMLASYQPHFEPMKDAPYWEEDPNFPMLRPDPRLLRQRGRPKSTRIRNEMDWRENQHKQSCGLCNQEGHNRKKCPNAISNQEVVLPQKFKTKAFQSTGFGSPADWIIADLNDPVDYIGVPVDWIRQKVLGVWFQSTGPFVATWIKDAVAWIPDAVDCIHLFSTFN
uniref:SWIM-type domain-containing protein n=2 Tax=Fagus sylvatica TaxID=28930 RepID=A0A2N9HX13_FAGSY